MSEDTFTGWVALARRLQWVQGQYCKAAHPPVKKPEEEFEWEEEPFLPQNKRATLRML